jgi:Protocatechuate 3,4-dioxygenase beta subunit
MIMKKILILLSSLLTLAGPALAQKKDKLIGTCEGCELMFEGMPAQLSWQANIAPTGELGEPLIIMGTILKNDGKTPASGIVLYVYHTDNKGEYSLASGQVNAKRHGHLRGWIKTDAQGRYEFKTIRPASYPNSRNPQHIHPILHEPGKGYYWIDEFVFDDDPLLGANERSRVTPVGGSGLTKLKKNQQGVWEGKRDIILGLNVRGY